MGDNYNCTINDCHYTHYSVFVRHLHAAVLLVCLLFPFFGLLHHQTAYIYIESTEHIGNIIVKYSFSHIVSIHRHI